MADRKKQVKQAISESVEMSKAPKPAKPTAKTPSEKLKSFSLNQREKAEDAAPLHPQAVQTRSTKNQELAAGMEAGRQVRSRLEAEGVAKVAAGQGIVGHKKVTRQGVAKIVAQPAVPPIKAEQVAPPAATKKPKPSKPKRMKKASTPQLRFKG